MGRIRLYFDRNGIVRRRDRAINSELDWPRQGKVRLPPRMPVGSRTQERLPSPPPVSCLRTVRAAADQWRGRWPDDPSTQLRTTKTIAPGGRRPLEAVVSTAPTAREGLTRRRRALSGTRLPAAPLFAQCA